MSRRTARPRTQKAQSPTRESTAARNGQNLTFAARRRRTFLRISILVSLCLSNTPPPSSEGGGVTPEVNFLSGTSPYGEECRSRCRERGGRGSLTAAKHRSWQKFGDVSLLCLTHTPPGGGGWVQKLALEDLGDRFLSVGSPYGRGGLYSVPP